MLYLYNIPNVMCLIANPLNDMFLGVIILFILNVDFFNNIEKEGGRGQIPTIRSMTNMGKYLGLCADSSNPVFNGAPYTLCSLETLWY